MRRVALVLASLTLIGAAPEDEDNREILTIRTQWMGGYCTGLCPAYKIDIADGWVTGFSNIGLGGPIAPVHFRIDHAQYLRARARMATVKPAADKSDTRTCRADVDGAAMEEVVWYDGDKQTVRRAACPQDDDRPFHCAILFSLIDVGINPFGGEPYKGRRDAEVSRQYLKEHAPCGDGA